ncbi:MAG TPA: carboxypeptidase-like regulatory domain-containing protein [Polyangiaceae bacterium]|jgi:hypothetical protein|nr:carboxypeptidase-like regulatory domain-containing protein [Polyangiaceae bacterium]
MKAESLVVACFSVLTAACDPVGVTQGTVLDAHSKAPISGAAVTLDCGNGSAPATTDANGRYEISQVGFLSPSCEVEAKKAGYSIARKKIDFVCADQEHCRKAEGDMELSPAQ